MYSNKEHNDKLSLHLSKLSLHLSRSIVYSREINLPEPKITYDNNGIKQYDMEVYLSSCLGTNLSEESMTTKDQDIFTALI